MPRKKVIFASLLILPAMLMVALFIKVQDYEIWYFCLSCSESYLHYSFDYSNKVFMKIPNIDCRQSPPFLVFLVTTTHGQKEARSAIRQTWGKERLIQGKKVVTYFLMGTRENESAKEKVILAQESIIHRDIIQRNFLDTYYNLTIKTLMGLDWITHHCPQASYVMKTDTDMFINTFYLVELLLRKNQTTNFFTGILKPNDSPIRNIFSKWYINKREYAGEKYPPFCSGTGYVLSTDVAQKIYNISMSTPFFKLEDVYVGMCLERLKIPLQELHSKETFFASKLPFSVCTYRNIVTSHEVQPHEILLYWQALQRSGDEHC
ncbi:beta-1,3-galactosyltransferase 5 [Hyla sarda]|uniref:beta-1,3-galactosyltransferase 5 n=1 Tax=Hyla sarda TaxID=327740 RepID=UPI0024C2706E|nr:beta-1,3-galactosyltransferase 5 [Hyla sarda]XP_056415664.1 beta-1,3-galactosyltransferase 5 [Hyla sarda]XP_056415665.1 beta-1,3-galactosyltransferase 5 [Hyla sarda]XP_056415666.1 beta-1,3-galactosyltransferase 5 [Hyla sarda]XP_056415667.1 beta-1,3-galactosyltransferase 5 [Hyla sarda]XP_056415668.1 beta-1,3-galactosyltransferase 5 [Hyla sarda]